MDVGPLPLLFSSDGPEGFFLPEKLLSIDPQEESVLREEVRLGYAVLSEFSMDAERS